MGPLASSAGYFEEAQKIFAGHFPVIDTHDAVKPSFDTNGGSED
jgi:hypothetical protein